ncbi:DUF4242 domain-containing protein [Psychromarinibacter sp. C21-152]|uniref:DUF4242 domain-containing protein n=1 Tax=Psychromarinibacter sediminicola TaxID=3033385 RepID=A0AAE3NUL8_9RHOB|nr:nickel-binding protein [Psychromarinibacter sediminicola]MDF0602586.1 DUF4242 domain-containing protein [Psychromarinibacter sediminicola]
MSRMTTALAFAAALYAAAPAFAGQFVVELDAPLPAPSPALLESHAVTLDETLSAGPESYAVFTAADMDALEGFLDNAAIDAGKISEVLFVNSPTVGGGAPAGPEPRDGHGVFVIERPIPGVGFFGLEKKRKISQNSNAAIEKLGEIIEWDHSYLTSEGTYCVYRADSPETLREHGALAGAPIGKITLVEQRVH